MIGRRTAGFSVYAFARRWHFLAGLAVAPFFILLAVTGALYLLVPDIERQLHPDLMQVERASEQVLPSIHVASIGSAYPGAELTRYRFPKSDTASAEWGITTAAGERRDVFIDPASGEVLGSLASEARLAEILFALHGSLMAGTLGDYIVELAASWGFAVLAMGLVLWWPRKKEKVRFGGLAYPRLGQGSRVTKRDLHAVGGAWNAAIVGFLIVSGLPWSSFWGGNLQKLGEIAPFAAASPNFGGDVGLDGLDSGHNHSAPIDVPADTPWPLERFSVTTPAPNQMEHAHGFGFDEVFQLARAEGLAGPGLTISAPRRADDVFRINYVPNRAQDQRSLFVDPLSGDVLADISFDDYSPLAKAVEFGVMIHSGRQFGAFNKWALIVSCLILIATVVLAIVMWLRRRPSGRIGVPARTGPPGWVVIGTTGLLAVVFPLFGLSLVALLAFVWGVSRFTGNETEQALN